MSKPNRPLELGDRVRLCGFGNVGGETSDIENRKGTVVKATGVAGRLTVRRDGDEWDIDVYPSQCRRLKAKRVPRRVWVELTTPLPDDCWTMAWGTLAAAKNGKYDKPVKFVEFVEVMPNAETLPKETVKK